MSFKLPSLAVIFTLVASTAFADMIVVNERFIVAKDSIRGLFYRDSNRLTVLDIRWSDWSTKYRCQTDYERARATAAMLNMRLDLEDADAIDFGDFLESEGFKDCKRF